MSDKLISIDEAYEHLINMIPKTEGARENTLELLREIIRTSKRKLNNIIYCYKRDTDGVHNDINVAFTNGSRTKSGYKNFLVIKLPGTAIRIRDFHFDIWKFDEPTNLVNSVELQADVKSRRIVRSAIIKNAIVEDLLTMFYSSYRNRY